MPYVDPKLYEYCDTKKQRQILELLDELGSGKAVADRIGVHRSLPQKTLKILKEKAARRGYSPEHDLKHPAPDGFILKGASTYYNKEGQPTGQWVKLNVDHQRQQELMQAAVEAMAEEITPCAPIVAPDASQGNLATLYTFTDYHVGMLAWHREGGDDWDCTIAEETGIKAMQALVAGAPPAEHGIVNIQGDFMHYDGFAPVTPMHGHILDADSRFGRVVEVSVRLIRQLVALALQKHSSVTLLICEGNHDLASSLWLRKLFGALYENEPRLTVHDSELPYYAIEWGNTLLGFHHGHLRKNDQLPVLFATQFREQWGRCAKVYIHTGHRHHKEDKEHTGARVIQHPTLAARDAYASRGGWFGERAITAITYHKSFGEVGTVTVTPEMLEAA